jgi:hypothetical protein
MYSTFPQQKVSRAIKATKEWQKGTIDYLERMSRTTVTGNRTSNLKKLTNYELFNGRFDKRDLEYVVNPIGLAGAEFPATLQHYDILSPAIMLLIGEEAAREDNQIVVSEGPDDIDRKKANIAAKVKEALYNEIRVELGEVDPKDVAPPEEIIKYEKYTTSDLIESQANKLLKVLKKHLDLKNVFKKGWKDALIAGEEIYWSGIVNGEPVTRRCNPIDINAVMPVDSDFVDDAVAVTEVRLMPLSVVLDTYGDDLTSAQITELEDLSKSFYGRNFNEGSFNLLPDNGVEIYGGNNTYSSKTFDGSIRVVRVEWLSMCKVGILKFTDPDTDQPSELEIDETFNLKNFKETIDADAKVEWFWINEAWEGTKIHTDMYIGVRAKPNQRRRLDNPYHAKLGYTGMLYNATNSVGVSLVDRMKPYQYLYNILMYRLELAFASDMGKVFLMDLAQIPRSEGISIEQWMYYLKSMKIGFINSFEESQKGTRIGQISNFNQFQSIDMSLANTIQQYIDSLEYIKQQIAFLSGVSPQRLSSIKSSELVGNVERSIEQSSYITNYWFDMHNEVKRRTYTALIECAKIAYRKGVRRQYVLDDMGVELLEINGRDFENSEFSVYVSNSTKDFTVKEQMKSLFQTALTADKATLSDIVEILNNDSMKDIQHKLQRNEQMRAEQAGKAEQAQAEAQQQMMQLEMEAREREMLMKERELDLEEYKINVDNQTKIQVAELNALSFNEDKDVDDDGIPDVVEMANLSLNQRKVYEDSLHKEKDRKQKESTERLKIKNQKDIEDQKVKLKEKELKSKEKIEALKSKTQIRVARTNAANKPKPKPKSK